jgi:hypothetical protein
MELSGLSVFSFSCLISFLGNFLDDNTEPSALILLVGPLIMLLMKPLIERRYT